MVSRTAVVGVATEDERKDAGRVRNVAQLLLVNFIEDGLANYFWCSGGGVVVGCIRGRRVRVRVVI
jgi:hypothetical protein